MFFVTRIGFIHVPKTGGLGFARWLKSNQIPTCGGHRNTQKTLRGHDHPHHMVTLIRDPLQTYISFYKFVTRHRINLYKHETPADHDNMRLIWGDMQAQRNPDISVHGEPQVSLLQFLQDCPPNQMFGYYYDNPEALDIAGRTENLPLFYDMIEMLTGLKPDVPVTNVNPEKNMSQPYPIPSGLNVEWFKRRMSGDYDMYYAAANRHMDLASMMVNA